MNASASALASSSDSPKGLFKDICLMMLASSGVSWAERKPHNPADMYLPTISGFLSCYQKSTLPAGYRPFYPRFTKDQGRTG